MSYPGKFIVIEAPDGAGKTTQVGLLCDYLTSKNIEHVRVREPGGTPMGEKVRDVLKSDRTLTREAELLLLAACRAQLVNDVIRPALKTGKVVIADRYLPSTIAMQYRPYGDNSTMAPLAKLMVDQYSYRPSEWGTVPDLTVFLHLPYDELTARIEARGEPKDRFEENEGYRRKVYNAYWDLIHSSSYNSAQGVLYTKKRAVIDAKGLAQDKVAKLVRRHVDDCFSETLA